MSDVTDEKIKSAIEKLKRKTVVRKPSLHEVLMPYVDEIEELKNRGIPYTEIADEFGLSTSAFCYHLKRAKEKRND